MNNDEAASERKKSDLWAACLKEAHSYQRRFRSVQSLSSEDFLRKNFSSRRRGTAPGDDNDDNDYDVVDYVLLDARTAAERKVSIIQGAISVSDYQGGGGGGGNSCSKKTTTVLICYCTIGYRSGLEATRLQQLYPEATVYNLDGIVAFSHAVSQLATAATATAVSNSNKNTAGAKDDHHHSSSSPPHQQLVDPVTGETVRTVHTFASLWNYVNPDQYDSVHFPTPILPLRFLQVGARVVVRHSQTLWHHTLGQCCLTGDRTTTTRRKGPHHQD
jgi:rhodanese-related sulfurtransferase